MSTTSSGSDYPKSDVFSRATKLEVKRLAGNQCWACGTLSTQVCHVFSKEDPQIPLWYDANLVNFDLTSANNGIALCPTCHVEFDQTADPGFVLLPTDLQYFIDFELNDRHERSLESNNANDSRRKVPTAEDYKAYQLNAGKVSADAIGGLYRPVFLRNYLLGGRLSSEVSDSLSTPRPWHGAPMGTLRRAILVLGGARVRSLGREILSRLELLRDLYFLDDEKEFPLEVNSRQAQPAARRGNKRRHSDDEQGEQNKRLMLKDSAGEPGNKRGGEHITSSQCSHRALDVSRQWTLGPNFTAEAAVQRYAPILSHE